jgi:hypothetical protein
MTMSLERIDAELQIRNLYALYGFAADARDTDTLCDNSFMPDVQITFVGGQVPDPATPKEDLPFWYNGLSYSGREFIRARSKTRPSIDEGHRHLIMNVVIRSFEPDRVAALAAYLTVHIGIAGGPPAEVLQGGHYVDEFRVDVDGKWKISKREIHLQPTMGQLRDALEPINL